MITINFHHRPISWQRPKQNGQIRFDGQKKEKAMLSFEALQQVKVQVSTLEEKARVAGRTPLFKRPFVKILAVFKDKNFFLKQDVDNIAKFYLDMLQSESMQRIVWEDDACITSLSIEKREGSSNKVTIEISEAPQPEDTLMNILSKLGLLN